MTPLVSPLMCPCRFDVPFHFYCDGSSIDPTLLSRRSKQRSDNLLSANSKLDADRVALEEQVALLKAEEERDRLESLESLARLEEMAEKVYLSLQVKSPEVRP